ncbi:hypothetical protein L873DRAFT_1821651 [Choiromyces venosus 120613-1]|uniref:Uncharacterized protein n=1 Tax=Choiromyces venosus 120613-1 TaxID=1336337 RepID=A0A3N4IVB5_9PEZI|nr:hypothetical protein L873DRAFT_1821651 [Choiromyces venosus 120613-1]
MLDNHIDGNHKFSDTNKRFERIEEKTNKRFDRIDEKIQNLDKKIDAVDVRLSTQPTLGFYTTVRSRGIHYQIITRSAHDWFILTG